jgi:dolichol-phosphate mannosyltransferase
VKFVLSYFTKPINVFGGIGAFAFLIGAAINAYVLIRKIFLQGQWMSPLFFTGMLLCALSIICFLLGFLAEILVRLYFESRENKFYKMKNKINA